MKVCIINNIYPPYHRGGAEQVVVKSAQGLVAQGHDVVIITSAPRGDFSERHEHTTIYRRRPPNVYFYTDAHKHSGMVRFIWHVCDIFNFSTASWVKNILEKEKPDIVHTHNLIGLSFFIPSVIRKLGLRHIHTVHDVQLVEPSAMILKDREHSWRYTGFPTKIYTWVMKKLMGSPQVVISPSQFLLDFYTKRGFFPLSKTVVVRNPLTFDFTLESREQGTGNRKQGNDLFNFLYLGQIETHKGIFLLIEAFKNIQLDMQKQIHLHIVGNGSQLDEVIEKTKGNVHITVHGRVERDKLPELFSRMNVTVVPSLCYENSPTVIFESLFFHIPVLASRIEGIAELIEEGESGITFEAGNVASLAEKMKWAIEHPQDLHIMSNKTTQMLSGLTQEKYIEKLVSLYSQ
ncbi:MAG: glycosyltransferase family 4 protein [Candidatus Magasanikbacteria bacterium]